MGLLDLHSVYEASRSGLLLETDVERRVIMAKEVIVYSNIG